MEGSEPGSAGHQEEEEEHEEEEHEVQDEQEQQQQGSRPRAIAGQASESAGRVTRARGRSQPSYTAGVPAAAVPEAGAACAVA